MGWREHTSKMLNKWWHMYIVECADGTYYTGATNDLNRRVRQHNGEESGGSKYCSGRRPVKLVYYEGYRNRSDAQKREHQVKYWNKKKKKELVERFKMD